MQRLLRPQPPLRTTSACAAACLALALAFAPLCGWDAFAATRTSDIIGGASAQERGLNMTNSPSIEANYAYVVDEDGQVYFERDADVQTHIASITKIMTAIVALENADLSDTVTISVAAGSVGESSAGLMPGDELSLKDALKGLMVPSGNDAAIAIADAVGESILEDAESSGDTVSRSDGTQISPTSEGAAQDAFVVKMNEKAKELGCENTLYANSHGLDVGSFASDMHSSARDVATISAYAMENEFFRGIVDLPSATLEVRHQGELRSVTVTTTDELIGNYDGACGIKTGFTDAAGACFSGACNRDGTYLYAIILDSPTEAQRFRDAQALFDWVYSSQKDYALANSDLLADGSAAGFEEQVPVIAQASLADWNGRTVPVTLADPDATVKISSIFGNVSQSVSLDPVSGSIAAGDVVGEVEFYQHNELVATQDLVACESVDAPGIFDSIGIAWERLVSSLGGTSLVADTVIYNHTPLLLEKS